LRRASILVLLALFGAPAAQGQTRSTFLVTDVGIGRLNDKTAYTIAAVTEAVAGLPVKAVTLPFSTITIPALEVTRDGKRLLLVYGREGDIGIGRLATFAPESATSTGVKIGMPMGQVFSPLPVDDCRNGLQQQSGLVFCPAADLQNIRYAFRCNHNATPEAGLPPKDVLARCPLEEIIWIAPD